MSDPRSASPPAPSLVEMDGRIAEIEAQRSMAQNRCIVLAGRVAELMDLLKIHRAEIERLTALVTDGDEADLAAAAAMHVAPAGPLAAH